jgi:hypothetical protein
MHQSRESRVPLILERGRDGDIEAVRFVTANQPEEESEKR